MTYLPILFGYQASNVGNSHIPLSLCRFWHEGGRTVKLIVPSTDKNISDPWLQPAMTGLKKGLIYKLNIKDQARSLAERKFVKSEKSAPVVYLWAGS